MNALDEAAGLAGTARDAVAALAAEVDRFALFDRSADPETLRRWLTRLGAIESAIEHAYDAVDALTADEASAA